MTRYGISKINTINIKNKENLMGLIKEVHDDIISIGSLFESS